TDDTIIVENAGDFEFEFENASDSESESGPETEEKTITEKKDKVNHRAGQQIRGTLESEAVDDTKDVHLDEL
ncbi:hypothetical protein EBR66_07945, partial [bacterium]|nr:hypothetical protein [bacterium]